MSADVIDTGTLQSRRILVTGASGFIGYRLVEKLAGVPSARVTAIVRNPQKAAPWERLNIRLVKTDLNEQGRLTEVIRHHDIVINLAHDFLASGLRNIAAFNNLVTACISADIERLVHTSSIVVYDDWPHRDVSERSPSSPVGHEYKTAKIAMERILRERANAGHLKSVIVQPSIVYGPGSWLWTDQIVDKLLSGTLVLPERCDGVCNAVYVEDVVAALMLASTAALESVDSFIISGPHPPPTWREFFEAYNQLLGTDSIRYVELAPIPESEARQIGGLRSVLQNPLQAANWEPIRYALRFAKRTVGETNIHRLRSTVLAVRKRFGPIVYYPTPDEIRLYNATGHCNIEKARQTLGYEPAFDFAKGIVNTKEYVQSRNQTAQNA